MPREISSSRINLFRMLWERKIFYAVGFIIGEIILIINKMLGQDMEFGLYIVLPISCSFVLGYLIYLVKREPKRLRTEGRGIILSPEGVIHIALSLGSLFLLGLIYTLLK